MKVPKFRTHNFLRAKYVEIGNDPTATIEQKFKALSNLERLMRKVTNKGNRKNASSNLPNLRNKKASPPVEVKKPDEIAGKFNSKLLGNIEE